jgi:hypothetical protein
MTEEFIVRWTFSPIDYFEEPVEFQCGNETIRIENGHVESRIPPDRYIPDHSIRDQLHKELNLKFLAAQVLNHKPYTLNKPSLSQGNNVWLVLEGLSCTTLVGNIDIIHYDKSGNVVRDSKRERIEKNNNFMELITKYSNTDSLLVSLLKSYDAAVRDVSNEFVHLYEIRDALATRFGNGKNAQKILGISDPQWSDIGHLCNNKEIKQGRHRGQNPGTLRNATEEELKKARDLALIMIFAYLNHLEATSE